MNPVTNQKPLQNGVEGVPGLKRRLLTVRGGPLFVYEAGDPGNPAVLLLHGSMYDEARFIWDQLFPFLSGDYHVFALDMPRHGKSRPWEGTLSHGRLLGILQDAVAQLGLTRFSLAGLSMGGGLGIGYAALHPEQVRSLVLFEPGGLGDKVDLEFFTWLYIHTPGMLRLLSRIYVKKDDKAIRKLLNFIYVGGSKPTDPDRLTEILKDEIKGKFDCGENDLDDWQLDGVIGPFRLKWSLLDQIPRMACPSLWLRGAESRLVKQHEMERAVRLASSGGRQATLRIIPHAGHILPLEQPEQVNPVVKVFLDQTAE